MKYWLITSEYPPFFGGGIGTYCVTTAHMMRDKGHSVTVFIGDPSVRDVKVEVESGIRVVRFNTSRMGASEYLGHTTNISYEFAHILKEFIEKEGKPDCIESQEYLGIAYYLLQYKLLLSEWCHDVPVVITMHSPSFLYMEYNQVSMYRHPNYWICEMERFCLQAADLVISPSRYMLEELAKRFELRNKNVQIIPNPFDQSINGLVIDEDRGDADQIVFFGKLTAQKGAFRLMAYFQELWDKGFEKPLYLIGGQDIVYHPEGLTMGDIIRKKYKSYISRGLLLLEDRVKPKEIRSRLSKAAIVIVPSDNDNLPYVVFEMMALGKLLLVSKQGGQSEVIEDGVNGFVFDHFEGGDFERGLRKAMDIETSQRRKFVTNGLERLQSNYSPAAVYPKKIAAIEKMISQVTARKEFPFIRLDSINGSRPGDGSIQGKLSIVVPYFNMGRYIDETVESLIKSNYSPKEILIINDGSTEPESIRALDKYRNREGVKVIDSVNGGLAKARNLGARNADGEFMAFLDSDDTIAPDYYSRAIRLLKQYDNVHFVGCWVKYFENSKKIWPTFIPEPPLILYQNMVNSSGLVYKKESFLTGGKNDDGMIFTGLEDYESVVSMLESGYGCVVIPEPLFNYRVRSDSMIRDITKSKKLYLMQYISQKHKDIYGKFAADTFNLLNANGPGISQDNPTLDHHLADKLPFNSKFSVKAIQLVKKNKMVRTVAYKVFKLLKKMKNS